MSIINFCKDIFQFFIFWHLTQYHWSRLMTLCFLDTGSWHRLLTQAQSNWHDQSALGIWHGFARLCWIIDLWLGWKGSSTQTPFMSWWELSLAPRVSIRPSYLTLCHLRALKSVNQDVLGFLCVTKNYRIDCTFMNTFILQTWTEVLSYPCFGSRNSS